MQDLTTTEVTLARRCLLTFGSSCQSLVKLLWLSEINDSAVRSFQEILNDGMVLLQKGLHLLNKILCVDLGSLVLISETLHFFVKKLLDSLKVNMEALFI